MSGLARPAPAGSVLAGGSPLGGGIRAWLAGARPRTLSAALSPVAVGGGAAAALGHVVGWRLGAALVVSAALQIGVNFANDYADGTRGVDEARQGPLRLVASGSASPKAVLIAAWVCFGIAGASGAALAAATSSWLFLVGAGCVAGAWFYSGGPKPYANLGLGEVFVFVFFGIVATVGTAFVAAGRMVWLAWWAAVPVGLLACGLLAVNNLRDIETDRLAKKATLEVRLGEAKARILYVSFLAGAYVWLGVVAYWRPGALVAFLSAPLAFSPARDVLSGARGRQLVAVLARTGLLQLVFSLSLAAGLIIG